MKTNIHTIRTLLATLLLAPLVALHAADAPKPATKPNIIFILADDLGMDGSAATARKRAKLRRSTSLPRRVCVFRHVMPCRCVPHRIAILAF
jgi:hypothetical protein